MDREKIERMVNEYIEELIAEFGRFAQEMTASGKGAQEEIDAMGLPEELFMDLWDPQSILSASKAACSVHTDQIFLILDGMDLEEEQEARNMIGQRLREIVDDFSFPHGGEEDISDR